jgi:hypothetical protein
MLMKYKTTEHRSEKWIVRVHKPILTPEEEKARKEAVREALIRFGREKMKNAGLCS